MKKIKILTTLMAVSMLASITVSATGGDGEYAVYRLPKTYSERLAEINNDTSLTATQKATLRQKLSISEGIKNGTSAETYALSARDYEYELDVPYFKQDNSSYCGPATTKQTITFYDSSYDLTQDEIAPKISATIEDGVRNAESMREYINANIPERNAYLVEENGTLEDMNINMKVACRDFGPPILRMKGTTSSWRYSNSSGHYMNVSGAYYDSATDSYSYRLTDPWIEYIDATITSGTYIESDARVHQVIQNHFAKTYWW